MAKQTILINDNRTLFDIRREFNEFFPDLKLEFYAKPYAGNRAETKKFIKGNSTKIVDCRTLHSNGRIILVPLMTIKELEDIFRDKFGLLVQVFCRSGRKWLEIAATETWTLAKQNGQCAVWKDIDVLKEAS